MRDSPTPLALDKKEILFFVKNDLTDAAQNGLSPVSGHTTSLSHNYVAKRGKHQSFQSLVESRESGAFRAKFSVLNQGVGTSVPSQ